MNPAAAPPTEAAISALVETFYAQIRRDPVLGPVFHRAIGEDDAAWAAHLARLKDFWSAMALRTGRYRGNPFAVHLRLEGLEPAMFDRWLALFGATCDEVLPPHQADFFRDRAGRIARSLRMGIFERLPARG